MMRSLMCHPFTQLAMLCVALLLAGCQVIPEPSHGLRVFTLDATPAQTAKDEALHAAVPWSLAVDGVKANRMIDSSAIVVRMVGEANELRVYPNAEWADAATDQFHQQLIQHFQQSGRITNVAQRRSGLSADYLLNTRLTHFGAAEQNDELFAEVRLEASLVTPSSGHIVAHTVINSQAPVPSKDVAATVATLNSVSADAMQQLVDWTLAAPNPSQP